MSHYFTNDKVKSNLKTIDVNIKDKSFSLYTDNNVFSKNKVDFGTKLLLESIDDISGRVLDLGCGYGVIGVYLRLSFDCNIDMVDINQRAIDLTNMNIQLNKLNDINAFISDSYSNIKNKYDYIITNPPIRTGKEKVYEILFEAKKYLNKFGKLILVIRKEQGAKSLIKDLEKVYKVSILNKKSGFFIINAEKS